MNWYKQAQTEYDININKIKENFLLDVEDFSILMEFMSNDRYYNEQIQSVIAQNIKEVIPTLDNILSEYYDDKIPLDDINMGYDDNFIYMFYIFANKIIPELRSQLNNFKNKLRNYLEQYSLVGKFEIEEIFETYEHAISKDMARISGDNFEPALRDIIS